MEVLFVAIVVLAAPGVLILVLALVVGVKARGYSDNEIIDGWARSAGLTLLSVVPANPTSRQCRRVGCFDVFVVDARGAQRVALVTISQFLGFASKQIKHVQWDDQRTLGFPVLNAGAPSIASDGENEKVPSRQGAV